MGPVTRRSTRPVPVRGLVLGGANPVVVQGMIKRPAHDGPAVLDQVEALRSAGCELCRLAVPDAAAAATLGWVAQRTPLPLVADIHFDHRLALLAIDAGAAKLRVNPGNLGGQAQLREVANAATAARIPIRVGVNLGSLEHDLAAQHGYSGRAMAESALRQVRSLEDLGFDLIVISAKAPDVARTVEAYRQLSQSTNWPLHIGVTEAGPGAAGLVKSAVGIGILLAEGIGDTIRVSLTEDAVAEIDAAYSILQSLGLRQRSVELVSCPTCGRCQFDLLPVAQAVAERLKSIDGSLTESFTVAVMGCAVNGPGEARRADVGVAGAAGDEAVLFAGGQVQRIVPAERAVDELMAEINRLLAEKRGKERSL